MGVKLSKDQSTVENNFKKRIEYTNIMLWGNVGVGRNSISTRCIENTFSSERLTTIGV